MAACASWIDNSYVISLAYLNLGLFLYQSFFFGLRPMCGSLFNFSYTIYLRASTFNMDINLSCGFFFFFFLSNISASTFNMETWYCFFCSFIKIMLVCTDIGLTRISDRPYTYPDRNIGSFHLTLFRFGLIQLCC